MSEQVSTSLYRHFASDGALLYVGISLSWPTRTKSHLPGNHRICIRDMAITTILPAEDYRRQVLRVGRPRFDISSKRGK